MRSFLFWMLILNHSCLFAQKIFGVISDENHQPLPFTSVVLKGTSKGVTANNKGAYSLSLASGKYYLVFQHIGYEAVEKEIELNEDFELNIDMLSL